MTTERSMKRAKGVHKRVGSAQWAWGIKAPQELRHLYSQRWAHRASLGTPDLVVANERAAALEVEWLGRFAVQRRALNPVLVETITPALRVAIAADIRWSVLLADQNMRSFPEVPNGLLASEARRAGRAAPEGSTPVLDILDTLGGLNDEQLGAVAR